MKRRSIQKERLSVTVRIVKSLLGLRTGCRYRQSKGRSGWQGESRRSMSKSAIVAPGGHKRSARTAVPRFTRMTRTIQRYTVFASAALWSTKHSSQENRNGAALRYDGPKIFPLSNDWIRSDQRICCSCNCGNMPCL